MVAPSSALMSVFMYVFTTERGQVKALKFVTHELYA